MPNVHPRDMQLTPVTSAVPVMVLVVEPHVDSAWLIEKALRGVGDGSVQVERVPTLALAIERLARGDIDVVLAGAHLPGCVPSETIRKLRLAAPEALVLPLAQESLQSAKAHDNGVDPAAGVADMDWLLGALNYVTRRKTTEAAWRLADAELFEEKERARVTLGSIGDAVLVTDLQGNVTYLNQVAEHLTGWTSTQACGQPLPVVFKITDRDTGKRAVNPALQAMAENTTVGLAANCVLHRLDGTEVGIEDSAAPVHDRYGQVTGAVIVFRDVNQSRTMTRKMAWLASHDSLTGLATRALFEERFRQVVSLAHRHARNAAMLFVDLDNFKQLNDVFGHRIGDRVLQVVARHLLNGVRDSDTVCRHGGDEFVILLADVADPAAAEHAASHLLRMFADPLLVDGQRVQVSMSIGISMYPDDGEDMHSLIERADLAMYQAKAKGDSTCFFDHQPRWQAPELELRPR